MQNAVARGLDLAFQLEKSGDLPGAWDAYQQVLRTDPRQPDALSRLGIIASEKKDFSSATLYFAEAVRAAPKNPALRTNLGIACLRADDPKTALVHLRKAHALSPRSAEACNLADCWLQLGKPQDAMKLVDRVLRAEPDNLRGNLLRARILVSLGQMDEAEMIYRDLIAGGAGLAEAYRGLASVRRHDLEAPELSEIEVLLQNGDLSRPERYDLCFAAGKLADDCGQYERAFSHFAAGKGCYESKFDMSAYSELVLGMQEILTPEFFAERRDFSCPSDRPVLVFGMPRSGTTLTEQMIGSHPQAKAGGELPFFSHIMQEFGFDRQRPDFFLKNISNISSRDGARIAEDYLAVLRRQSRNADRVVDKMPHNFEHVWLIALLFPDATFIHTKREPMDNCLSCFTNPLNETHNYTATLDMLGRYYRLYDRLTAHWEAVAPVTILNSRYEDLIADQDRQCRKLIDHTGLEWNDACLRHETADSSVRTLSSWQVRQPLYGSSVARWKKYQTHLDPLKDALGDLYREA